MKRWISLALCFLLCVGLIVPALLSVPVSAEAMSGSLNSSINYVLTEDGVLSITGAGAMPNYTSSNLAPWKYSASSIKKIIIGEGITHIGNYAFRNYNSNYPYGFTEVVLPSTLVSIGTYAFRDCHNLISLVLPSGLESVGMGAFVFCQGLQGDLIIPASVTNIGDSAFQYCSASSVIFEGSIPPSMGSYVFGNSSTKSFLVPYGSLSSYQAQSSGFSGVYGYLSESPPAAPSVPSLTTSFDGQIINVDAGGVNFYIHASNVNGTLSCEWYINGELYEEVFDFVEVEEGVWLQGWRYTATGEGIREIYAIVKNTLGDQVASVSTGTVILNVGNAGSGGGGSGDSGDGGSNTEVIEKLETLDLGISNIQSSVDNLAENVEQLPDEIKDGMEQLQEQEKQEASSTGDSSAQEVIEIIPNPSADFLPAIQNLVSVMSYDGTAAVLSLPAVSIPAIGNIVPNIKLLDALDIDFAEYVILVPDLILNFIRALFDSALVLYCLYELFTMIGSALSGFTKNISKGDLYE